ncbi:MAG: plasmid pRiA4b ORF-3 family protein [Proteobacteria bacterium]|nr:plasmid pRiA4b ORF-3 family protein [Pseudomonadota bacterium]
MGHTRYELHVQLRDIEPPIWRTIEVPGDASLEDVHFAIQVAMGWANSHLHHFAIGKQLYGMVDVDGTDDLGTVDERAYLLQDVAEAGAELVYEYDFGDRWEHDVTVTKVSTVAKPTVPRCLAGARACPPEDVGGPAGYDDLLEILGDAQHPDHASAVTWSHGFSPDAWKLPKGGLDLRAEMNELRRLADEAEIGALAAPHARGDSDGDGDGDGDGDALQLPQELVDAVLALEPMQRAALSAL